MGINYDEKNTWKKNTLELEGNFKLAIKANKYLDNSTDENLDDFKEELKVSSSLAMAAVISYLENLKSQSKKIDECNLLIELIKPNFEPMGTRTGVYDPMLGEIIYSDEENRKKKM